MVLSFKLIYRTSSIQGDQLYMAVFFWYLGKRDLSSEHVYSSIHLTSHFLQGTRKKPAMFDWSYSITRVYKGFQRYNKIVYRLYPGISDNTGNNGIPV